MNVSASMRPYVAALIPTKNRPGELGRTIETILAQSVPPQEIIIVDQSAGRDGQATAHAAYAAAPSACAMVVLRYFHTPEISSTAAARNLLLEKARQSSADPAAAAAGAAESSAVWCFFDDDVELEPDYIEHVLAAYAADPEADGVSGVITNYPPPPWRQRVWHAVFERGPYREVRLPMYWRAYTHRDREPRRTLKLTGALMSFRAGVLRNYHNAPQAACLRGEDLSFCAGLGPGKLVITPLARLAHKRSTQGRVREHWLRPEFESTRFLYHTYWRRGLVNRLCYAWLCCGFGLLFAAHELRGLRPTAVSPRNVEPAGDSR